MATKYSVPPTRNLLLAKVPPSSLEPLLQGSRIEEVQLSQTLFEEGVKSDIFFPLDAVISLLRHLEDGSTVEVGMAGAEGMASVSAVLGVDVTPHFGLVQGRGYVLRVPRESVEAAMQRDGFRDLLLRYVYTFLWCTSQQAACNRMHIVEKRTAHWLLLLHDRVGSDEMSVTQEFLARMLAARRAGINVAVRSLSEAGAIEHRRQRIRVINRRQLEDLSCECYQRNVSEYVKTMGFSPVTRDRVAPID